MNIKQSKQTKTALLIKVPKVTEDSLSSFQSFFNDLYKFVESRKDLGAREQTIAFELVLKEGYFFYRIIISKKLVETIKSLLYAKFKDIEVIENQPVENLINKKINIYEFGLKRSNFFPLKTQFTAKDSPYVTLSAILSKLDHFSEGIIIQLIIKPTSDTWLKEILREKFYNIICTLNSIKNSFEKPFLKREYIDNFKKLKKNLLQTAFSPI